VSRPVRIGMLDSGVHVGHPHLASVAGGVEITPDGEVSKYIDTLGHGTAVASLIHHLAPDAELFAVKIFDHRLATNLSTVLRAIDWCIRHEIDIINLSLGTTNAEHRSPFTQVIERVRESNAVLVSAYEVNGAAMLPGSLPGVVGVAEDASCDRHDYRVAATEPLHLVACPFPRDIEGVPREHNLRGVSFAVAHVSAQIARRWNVNEQNVDWLERLARERQTSSRNDR